VWVRIKKKCQWQTPDIGVTIVFSGGLMSPGKSWGEKKKKDSFLEIINPETLWNQEITKRWQWISSLLFCCEFRPIKSLEDYKELSQVCVEFSSQAGSHFACITHIGVFKKAGCWNGITQTVWGENQGSTRLNIANKTTDWLNIKMNVCLSVLDGFNNHTINQ
jgi:hypothetical protein